MSFELEALEFQSKKENPDFGFLVVTTSGDVIKAELIEANDKYFIFLSKKRPFIRWSINGRLS